MIRLSLLWLFVLFFSVYAWRDWYKSLCALIMLMAFVEHPDFPKSLMGIQGLNPWNLLLFFVGLAWASTRRREGLVWDMPKEVNWLLICFLVVIIVAFLRSASHIDDINAYRTLRGYYNATYAGLFSEQIINCIKWVIPGLLLFDGCNSKKRLQLAVFSVLAVYILLAIQVIRWMPFATITGGEALTERSLKILSNEVGYHRVNMSMILAGASWAIFSARYLVPRQSVRLLLYFFVATTLLGQALTGGRMGYVTWLAIAFIFGVMKWRKVLILAPIAVLILIGSVPAVKDRLLQGFSADTVDTNARIEAHGYLDQSGPDLYTITAGRTFAWPFVFQEIGKAPLFGHGRQGMVTTGLAVFLLVDYGEVFPHPHNAYLEWILDNGAVGAMPVLLLFYLVLRNSLFLFRKSNRRDCIAIGGICLSLVLALLVASMGSQTFYPREGAVGMWCAIGLMLRMTVQWQRQNTPRLIGNRPEQGVGDFWQNPMQRTRSKI